MVTFLRREGGVRFARRLSAPGDPYAGIAWETRDAVIGSSCGEPVFEQKAVEVPAFWSQTATNVVASKYFRGVLGTPQRESSVRHLFSRVVETLVGLGRAGGYFATEEDADVFADELSHLLLHQAASFNSPVWFNVGVEPRPQCSACFINSVADEMGSILDLAKVEAMLFKHGSGTGTNLSTLRSSREPLAGGGTASGPVSFMRGFDAFAGVIKSGGKTRRAAKMVLLDVDHPDIVEFIKCKEREERKAWTLIEAGYDSGFNVAGGAYDSVLFQNANHSVRVSDGFMRAVVEGGRWETRAVTSGEVMDSYPARDLLRWVARAAWVCGDPGLQFSSAIDRWHTCPNTAPIRASNPCSEFLFIDDSACNLASVNLLKFYRAEEGSFDVSTFVHACELLITAQEIMVDNAGYPTPAIERNSRAFRPLGLGFANLGALVMAGGRAYDSDGGRALAGAVSALMTGAAYRQSALLAEARGAFAGFEENRSPMLQVIEAHRRALLGVDSQHLPAGLAEAMHQAWDEALERGREHGFRNSQVTAIAPTGTIGFMMDCDTTGVEPAPAIVSYKRLVGGGSLQLINHTVPVALARLGYDETRRRAIIDYIEENETIEGAPELEAKDLPVFDCALPPAGGSRSIPYSGHLRMLAAVQPFISGAISKTINMPREATEEDVFEAYVEGWRLGLKALAIYRDGSKRSQPLATTAAEPGDTAVPTVRRRLPDERPAITHRFEISGHKGYITVGLYEDGKPGEIFLVMAKEGSTISGLMDAFATAVSIALQHGVPLETLIDKFTHSRFEPAGFTRNPEIPIAKSITDYIFRWLASKFLDREKKLAAGLVLREMPPEGPGSPAPSPDAGVDPTPMLYREDAPSCPDCGCIMVRNGTCYKCENCGGTSGCS
jgi:ribonucleoside-diphosphate reductase alpha chain